MSRNTVWENSDGLAVGFGTHSADNESSSVTAEGEVVTVKQEIDLTVLADAATALTASPQAHVIPRGSFLMDATIQTVIAATSSGSGTLDIGTWSRGKASEVVDLANGIVDAVTVAEMTTIGEIHLCDGAMLPLASGVTGQVGLISDSDVVIAPSYDTGAFQTGVILFVLRYRKPFGSAGRTIAV